MGRRGIEPDRIRQVISELEAEKKGLSVTSTILNQVNRARKAAGLELLPTSCVRLKRRIYRPFAEPVAAVAAGAAWGCLADPGVALDPVGGV